MRLNQSSIVVLASVLATFGIARAQTTQGLISGRVLNVRDGKAIKTAKVRYAQLETNNNGERYVNDDGVFALPLLPPGTYRIRVEAPDFQAQELHQLELRVAGTLDLVFRLRPLADVWEQRERHNVFMPGNGVLVFFGPDVDLSRTTTVQVDAGRNGILQSTFSQVVDPILIRELPLAGRDAYAALAMQPGVTSDSATSRGLGISVNGQRPSSSNFLLDGVENNNYLLSGPLMPVAPEAIQEYRVSTNNFSAEYGRTAGVVANAVTRSGGTQWHGLGYAYFKNEALNANDFQRNLVGFGRTPLKEFQPGFFAGGPLTRSLFASAAVETLRFRSRTSEEDLKVPSVQFLSQLNPDSYTAGVFRKYPPPLLEGVGPCVLGQTEDGCSADYRVAAPSSLNQILALGRVDKLFNDGAQRILFRTVVSRMSRPDFAWSPYPDFTSPLDQNATGFATTWIGNSGAGLTTEARAGWSTDELRFDRANSQIPGLSGPSGMLLPGSLLYYSYLNRSHNLEVAGNLVWIKDRNIFKMGGGFLNRNIEGYQTTGREGYYAFFSAQQVAEAKPSSVNIAVLRFGSPSVLPDYNREYHYRQWFGYFQGTWRATPRLSLNYGVRYENFGAPTNTGSVKDPVIVLGPGSTLDAALAASSGWQAPSAGEQRQYDPDNRNWAGRAGFAYSIDESGRTVVRGAYGIFYDRPFDNLWQTLRHNFVQLGIAGLNGQTWNYLESPRAVPGALDDVTRREIFQRVTLFQPGIRTPYVQSYFLGLRRILTRTLSIEVSALGSLGRELIATDTVNRYFGRANTSLPEISYRSNQGNSNYTAGTAVLSYRGRRQQWQAAYTWSHSIDNQSDALAGEYGDLAFAGPLAGDVTGLASFARQYDSSGDRGNSDFDQRHSLVLLGVVELPSPAASRHGAFLLKDWRVSWLGAVRSGFPFTVFGDTPLDLKNPRILNNRANVVNPSAVYADGAAVPGGKQLVNGAAFSQPGVGQVGTSGRNALQGPGFWNIDFSVSRSFPIARLGEAGRLVLRADAFNVLNHANLGTPDPYLSDGAYFGVATYGRQGYDTGFPAVAPFRETARTVQLMLRVEF